MIKKLLLLLRRLLWSPEAEFQRGLDAYNAKDYKTAFTIWQSLAEQGVAQAQYNLGLMYILGLGVSKHNIYAYMWLSLAKKNNNENAQESIKIITKYMSSEELAEAQALAKKCWDSNYQDCLEIAQANEEVAEAEIYKTAFTIWQPLAEQGHADAQYILGLLYYYGQGVEKDYGEALKWYSKAATQRDAKAQALLGAMYSQGLGGPKHNIYAYMWLSLAKANGVEEVQETIEALTKLMSSADIAKAKKLAKKCLESNYQDCPE